MAATPTIDATKLDELASVVTGGCCVRATTATTRRGASTTV